jgi:two-component sensor histidine kinase
MTDAFKHGFPRNRRGRIWVGIHTAEGKRVHVRVGNCRIRPPEEFSLDAPKNLGIKLVIILVEQLDGTVELVRNGITEFRITFEAAGDSFTLVT